MPCNYLITGPPRSGKTTVIQSVVDHLEAAGYQAGGIYCPEMRKAGDRVGFEVVDVLTATSRTMAHVSFDDGPAVGKYQVNVANVDSICAAAFQRAFDEADFLVIDEIAPMEVYSSEFRQYARQAFDTGLPLIAAIHSHSTDGLIGEIKNRDDTEEFEVTEETRDELPIILTDRLRADL